MNSQGVISKHFWENLLNVFIWRLSFYTEQTPPIVCMEEFLANRWSNRAWHQSERGSFLFITPFICTIFKLQAWLAPGYIWTRWWENGHLPSLMRAKFGPKYPQFVDADRIFGSKFASRDNQRSSIPWNSWQMIHHCPRYRWVEAAKNAFQRNQFQSERTNCLSPDRDFSIYSIADSHFTLPG